MNIQTPASLSPKDYATDQEVRWCPGCGDYAILKAVQKTRWPILGADPAKTVFVSGIGCAARFPYYMETYGFHTIHGRAPRLRDRDQARQPGPRRLGRRRRRRFGLSIGGNHTLHLQSAATSISAICCSTTRFTA